MGSEMCIRDREEIAAKGPPHSRDPGTTYDALRGDGTVWAWGPGNTGQLGNTSHAKSLVPARIPGLANISAIASERCNRVRRQPTDPSPVPIQSEARRCSVCWSASDRWDGIAAWFVPSS